MKKIILSIFVGTLASVSVVNFAKADCGPSTAPEVRVAIAYLSMVEHGGIPPFGEPGDVPSEEPDLCQELAGWSTSTHADGYTDYVLGFKDRSCEFLIKMMPDGKVGDIRLSGCQAK